MLPQEFLRRMEQMLGAEYPAFLQSYNEERHQALRVNTLKGPVRSFLEKAPFHTSPVAWEPAGFYYESGDAPGRHPYHAAGAYYIQEPSAMAVASYLDARPGERILDLCAAPGGKSTQIAAAMRGEGLLICNEIHPARAKILSENIERLGIRNCIVTNETPESLARMWEGFFDRILVDAPCSGEGMFRKNGDACDEWSLENVAHCAARQQDILASAAVMLRPGGRIVYSTCTFAPEENEGTISRFLEAHSEFSILPAKRYEGMSAGVPEWTADPAVGIEHTVRLFPHKLCGEGHFLAVLQKEGSLAAERRGTAGQEKGLSPKDCKEYTEFAADNLTAALPGKLIRFGGQLYLAPEDTPALKGLRVLRAGLHLGTQKKNRFEPAHALALAIGPGDVYRTLNFPAESKEIRSYLHGEAFYSNSEKGWYLLTADDYSIGWGKLAGGIMKNHYPKGLRINY